MERVEAGPKGAVITLRGNRIANPQGLIDLIQRNAGTLRLRPDQKIVYLRNWDDDKQRLAGVSRLLQTLVRIARAAKPEAGAAKPPAAASAMPPAVAAPVPGPTKRRVARQA